jgi:hypothetical protein
MYRHMHEKQLYYLYTIQRQYTGPHYHMDTLEKA